MLGRLPNIETTWIKHLVYFYLKIVLDLLHIFGEEVMADEHLLMFFFLVLISCMADDLPSICILLYRGICYILKFLSQGNNDFH